MHHPQNPSSSTYEDETPRYVSPALALKSSEGRRLPTEPFLPEFESLGDHQLTFYELGCCLNRTLPIGIAFGASGFT